MDVQGINVHPLDPDNINHKKACEIVPQSLVELLEAICGKMVKVYSIAQDIITVASNWKKRTPKSIGLGISMKNSLRSKEFRTILNNLGHAVSYGDVLRIETTWASSIIDSGDGYAS